VVAIRKYKAVHTTNIIATPNSDIRLLLITIIKATGSNQIVMHDKSLFRALFSLVGDIINASSQDMIKIGTDDPNSLKPSHIIDFLCNITRLVCNVTELRDTLHAEVLKCYLNVLERWKISEEDQIRFIMATIDGIADVMPFSVVTNYHSQIFLFNTTCHGPTMMEIIQNSSKMFHKVFCECVKQETLDELYWNAKLANDLFILWNDPVIKQVYNRRSEFHLINDNLDYYFDNWSRISATDYVPCVSDILCCHKKTIGVHEFTVTFKQPEKFSWRVVDFGKRRNEKRTWDHVSSIFIAFFY
jgi:hypothetical protein